MLKFESALRLLDSDYGDKGLEEYTARIKEGEKTLSQLKVELNMMTPAEGKVTPQKDNKTKGIEQRTHKASRLKQLIVDSFNNNKLQV